ncbi:unnamed protein product [Calicophoron daubneyi]|uniref:G-protein coupled receptors family 1 profile domain-containing protein n=1 Tax=Calicophoron daubneyi TaxID=300641 RepID=A0AAV2TH65_CALDB
MATQPQKWTLSGMMSNILSEPTDLYDPYGGSVHNTSTIFQPDQLKGSERGLVTAFHCCDDFYCTSPQLAFVRNTFMGWLGLVISSLCVIMNLMFLSGMGNRALRSTSNMYLTTVLSIDTLRILIYSVLHIIPALRPGEENQADAYHFQVSYVVPQLLPMVNVLELFMTLCLIGSHGVLLTSYRRRARNHAEISSSNSSSSNDHCLPFETSNLHRPRRMMIFTIFLIALSTNFPNFIRYKLVENPTGHVEHSESIRGYVFHTTVYKVHAYAYDLCLLSVKIVAWFVLLVLNLVLLQKRLTSNDKGFFKAPLSEIRGGRSEQQTIIDRRKMERLMTGSLGVLWLVPSIACIASEAISLHYLVQTPKSKNGSSLMCSIVVQEFFALYFTLFRTVACLATGVYIRRMLKNMFRFYLIPTKSFLSYSGSTQSTEKELDTWSAKMSTMNSPDHKISYSYSLVPLMLKGKSWSAQEMHPVKSDVSQECPKFGDIRPA